MEGFVCGILHGPQITPEEASCFATIPEVPVYRPKESEFREFAMCMSLIERMGAQHMGLCKIIPPTSWCPRRSGYKDINFTIEKPIIQFCTGTGGIYLQDVRAQKSMSFKKYEKMSNSSRLQTPIHASVNELEEIYWKSIHRLQPLYGANVSGSLTDPDQPYCNIPKLRSMLSDILAQEDIEIGGVNTPYLYFGAWATTFAWHVEDMDLYSINYLHFGAPKLWYCIPPAFARKFEAFAREHFKSEFLACRSFLRHKSILIDPKVLAAAGIPTRRILQYEGEIMCTFPYGYHAGFNTGVNCAESTNFALPRWVEYGKHASICTCWDDTVRIEMGPFVRRLQPHLFEAWQRGDQSGPHPLEIYTPYMRGEITTSINFEGGYVVEGNGLNLVDLNVRNLFYTNRALAEAALPIYLKRNRRLRPLWCGFKANPRTIAHFNQIVGTQEPFCSICAFFWSPLATRKALCEPHKAKPLLEFSEPYLSEVAFCRSSADFAKIHAKCDSNSRILVCSRCKVVVHASCYGLDELDCYSPTWKCDACNSIDDEPQCVLCPMRGGALKALANMRRSSRGERFWVHLACAIAVGPQQCCFLDVRRRLPGLLQHLPRHTVQRFSSPPLSPLAGMPRSRPLPPRDSLPRGSALQRLAFDRLGNRRCLYNPLSSPDSLTSTFVGPSENDAMEVKEKSMETSFCPFLPQLRVHPSGSALGEALASKSSNLISRIGGGGVIADTNGEVVVAIGDTKDDHQSEGGCCHRSRRRARPPSWVTQDYLLSQPQKLSKPIKTRPMSPQTLLTDTSVETPTSAKVELRDHCDECGLPSPGGPYLDLPLVACWHKNCPGRFHLTCAQFGGILIATSQYPHCFYIACRRHLSEYREFEHDEEEAPLQPGDMVYALHPGNGRYYKAVAVKLTGPQLCKVVFPDGTFSRDTPSNYIVGHDWHKLGPPKVGSQVKVKWTDNLEYSAVFQGASVDKWNVRFPNGQTLRLRRDKIFRVNARIPTHIRSLIMR
ncbi:Transcription factor JmjC domain containing protein [Echinococcus multilocularis]|uniref:Transcription factor JmjC domain containing protein n=1 Tax=Echinococcus multilocularis TaxID=6211 RepID=A0A068Y4R8_ECHMU|nr:Transcription factor JmjC domain containing protein [Echinococcus multilocularis]